jgi:hypothetical protein
LHRDASLRNTLPPSVTAKGVCGKEMHSDNVRKYRGLRGEKTLKQRTNKEEVQEKHSCKREIRNTKGIRIKGR